MTDANRLPVDLLRAMATGASDAFFVTDDALRIDWVNGRACELLRLEASELVGRRIVDLLWDARELEAAPLKHAELAAGVPTFTIRRFRTGDGRCVVLEVSAHRIGPGRLLGIARDVTERIAAEDRLARSEASFRAMIERSPDAIVVHRDGVIVFANAATESLLGFAPDALLGTNVIELVPPDDRPSVLARMRTLDETGTVPFVDERLLRRDGEPVACSITAVRLIFEGQPCVAAIARDLTEVRRAQTRLAHSERLAALGVLAAGVGHEINNPLTYVLLRLDAIADAHAKLARAHPELRAPLAALSDHVDAAREGAQRVRDIVSDLRVLSSAQNEAHVPVDVRGPLHVALGIADHELRRRARVELVLADVSPVLASEGRLAQIFLNLLLNAAHAIPEGAAEHHSVSIEVSESAGTVRIAFVDSGRGIRQEHLPRLFEPFFTTKAPGEGSGLGLAVSHRLVTGIGGTIEVESEEGRGSRFVVQLPAAPPTSHEPAPEPRRERSTPRRARLLVVDDEPAIAMAVRGGVGDSVEVDACCAVAEARRALAEKTYDVVLCDVVLPNEDGFALLDWIVAEHPALAARVVMTSGGRMHAQARAFAEANPDRWLDKPFDLATLERAVARALEADGARSG